MSRIPTLITFNIRRSIYQNFGLKHFDHLRPFFHLIPVINDHSAGIEDRAAVIVNKVKQFLQQNKQYEKVNLASYSLSGIDTRYALSCLGLDQYSQSLVTIGTPHRFYNVNLEDLRAFIFLMADSLKRTLLNRLVGCSEQD